MTTRTSTALPGVPAGAVQAIAVSLVTATPAAARPPKVTTGGPASLSRKPVPESTTAVPPREVPLAGATVVSVGFGW